MGVISTLTDDFNTADTSRWVDKVSAGAWNAYETVANGELVLTTTTNYDAHLESATTYDLSSSAFYAQITERPLTGGTNESEFSFFMVNPANANTYTGFSLLGDGKINVFQVTSGTNRTNLFYSFDLSATPFVRVRHSGSTFYWEKSVDGTNWTQIATATRNANMPLTGLKMTIQTGHWGTHDPMTAKCAAFNMIHVPPSSGPKPNMMMGFFAAA